MPTAPEPAQRSRNCAASTRGARILKSVSRKRSDVGRVSRDGGLFNLRPRYLPAMIRKAVRFLHASDGARPSVDRRPTYNKQIWTPTVPCGINSVARDE